MSTTTSNAALASIELLGLCHEFYAVGVSIVNRANNESISNTTVANICAQVKLDRAGTGKANSTHISILAALAAL